MDVDPEEGVMSRLDYITYADTLDCLVYFLSLSLHRSPCTIRSGGLLWVYPVRYDLQASFLSVLYDINLGATHTTILSTRGVQIPIYLASSATDSF